MAPYERLPGTEARERGITLPEVVIASLILVTVLVPLGNVFMSSVGAFSSLAKRAHVATRAPVVMDRMIEEMTNGWFTSLDPPVPTQSTWIRFQKVIDVVNGLPVYGNPIHIELYPQEADTTDGLDNDQDGLVDEGALRIWEDLAPTGTTPGTEDSPSIIATGLTKDGLFFTREGETIVVKLTFQYSAGPDEPVETFTLESAVIMRNGS